MTRATTIGTFASVGLGLTLLASPPAQAQRSLRPLETCNVQVLNQSTLVAPDGTWSLDNVPVTGGRVRARLYCQGPHGTRRGESALFTVTQDQVLSFESIRFAPPTPVPTKLTLSAGDTALSGEGATTQLTVVGTYPLGSEADLSAADTGTDYWSSNPAIASVDAEGLVTAAQSGTVMLSVNHAGLLATLQISVSVGPDADGDGLPDDWELGVGLDPSNPVDALIDNDGDGLNNLGELAAGALPFDPDSDDDGIPDGEEASEGSDGFVTNAALRDTDGDIVPDAVELLVGTDPTDAGSVDLSASVDELRVDPAEVVLVTDPLLGEVSAQLEVRAVMLDGIAVDVTGVPQLSWVSFQPFIAVLGATPGEIVAGASGTTTVAVDLAGHTAQVTVRVIDFAPTPLSTVELDCPANGLALAGERVYTACGGGGVQAWDLGDALAPELLWTLPTLGNANGIAAEGPLLAVAAGTEGLLLIEADTQASASLALPGPAWDVAIDGDIVAVATLEGLAIVSISAPSAPELLASVDLGEVYDVALRDGLLLTAGPSGAQLYNVSNPAEPLPLVALSSSPAMARVALGEGVALALENWKNGSEQIQLIDLDAPEAPPVLLGGQPFFVPSDVAIDPLSGEIAFVADVLQCNEVPVLKVAPAGEAAGLAGVDFCAAGSANLDGLAVAAGEELFAAATYAAVPSPIERRITGPSTLQIGRWRPPSDPGSQAPGCSVPVDVVEGLQGDTIDIPVDPVDALGVANVTLLRDGVVAGLSASAPWDPTHVVDSVPDPYSLTVRVTNVLGLSVACAQVLVVPQPDLDCVVSPPCGGAPECLTTCQPGLGCVPAPEDICDDGDPCTVDTCQPNGYCSHQGCNDGVDCTLDTCVDGGCVFVPDDSYCEGQVCDPVAGCPECGDGFVTGSEVCDDGEAGGCNDCCSAPKTLCEPETVALGRTEVQAMATSDDGAWAYAALEDVGLAVYDLTDPSAPLVAEVPLDGGVTQSMAVAGDRLYVSSYEGSGNNTQIFDLSVPSAPAPIGVPFGPVASMAAAGDTVAFIGTGGIEIWDVADPSAPSPGLTIAGQWFFGVAGATIIEDRLIFRYEGEVLVYDIAGEGAGDLVGSVFVDNGPDMVLDAAGDTAWLGLSGCSGCNHIRIVDLSDPTAPTVVDTVPLATGDGPQRLAKVGDQLYVTVREGQTALRVGAFEAATMEVLGFGPSFYFYGADRGLVGGGSALLVGGEPGPYRISLADPAAPVATRPLIEGVSVDDIVVDASGSAAWLIERAYIDPPGLTPLTQYGQLRSVDLSQPGQVTPVAVLPPAARLRDIARLSPQYLVAAGDILYGGAPDPTGLFVIDAPTADPSTLAVAGHVEVPGIATVVPAGDHAFALTFDDTLHAVDLTTPSAPALVASLDLEAYGTQTMALSGDLLFVSRDADFPAPPGDVRVFDVSDPSAPVHVASAGIQWQAPLSLVADGETLVIGLDETIVRMDLADAEIGTCEADPAVSCSALTSAADCAGLGLCLLDPGPYEPVPVNSSPVDMAVAADGTLAIVSGDDLAILDGAGCADVQAQILDTRAVAWAAGKLLVGVAGGPALHVLDVGCD